MSKNPTVSAVSSLAVPGLGQVYNGDWLRGFGWLAGTMLLHVPLLITTGGTCNVIVHGLSSYTAYKRAGRKNLVTMG